MDEGASEAPAAHRSDRARQAVINPAQGRYQAAFEHGSNAALIASRAGGAVAVNVVARRLLGADGPEHSLQDLFVGEAATLWLDLEHAALRGGIVALRPRLVGPSAPMPFTVAPIVWGDEHSREVLLTHAPAQDGLRVEELSQQLRQADAIASQARWEQQELQQSYETLKRFSALAAHDLKAPLRHIALFIQLLEREAGDNFSAQAREYVEMMQSATERVRSLVASLLEHTRAGANHLVSVCVSLDELMAELEREMAATFTEAGGTLRIEPYLGTVAGDRALTQRLLANLVGNAVKYRSPDRALRVEVGTVREGDQTRQIIVRDNGVGFRAEDREKIFEPFIRLGSALGVEGTGLGLATCRTICERHGWRIEAGGAPDRGAVFRIRIGEQRR